MLSDPAKDEVFCGLHKKGTYSGILQPASQHPKPTCGAELEIQNREDLSDNISERPPPPSGLKQLEGLLQTAEADRKNMSFGGRRLLTSVRA